MATADLETLRHPPHSWKVWTPACLTRTFQHYLLILILSNFKSFSVLSYLCYNDHIFHLTSVTPRVTPLTLSLPKLQMLQQALPFHHCLYLSSSSLLTPSFDSSTSPGHTIHGFYHLFSVPHSTHALTSLLNQVRTQGSSLQSCMYFTLASTSLAPLLLCHTCKTTSLVKPNQVCTPVAKRTAETYNHAH